MLFIENDTLAICIEKKRQLSEDYQDSIESKVSTPIEV
ncbi:hypothetical protein CK203_008231 [Vitis vinifera]|uniref:Uncharacterized protein n=1 Tax=Vitis vinifera TaxID=29760 RepID=A0A438KNH4_VITVI|nr:hypothetical protein CK203_008231 [Vitis vinifera]